MSTQGIEDKEVRWGWSFKFEPHWTRHEECGKVVEEAWSDGALDTIGRLDRVRGRLDAWSRATFPNFGRKKDRIKRALRALDRMPVSDQVLGQRKQLLSEMEQVEADE
ncbi:unnamed protein product [Linum trigynum]|uniref:Uncharacterized protein n=1 Tax=Linum trigynum TaxID=586398 RepID=A0AAV2GKZ9_9ROSI